MVTRNGNRISDEQARQYIAGQVEIVCSAIDTENPRAIARAVETCARRLGQLDTKRSK